MNIELMICFIQLFGFVQYLILSTVEPYYYIMHQKERSSKSRPKSQTQNKYK